MLRWNGLTFHQVAVEDAVEDAVEKSKRAWAVAGGLAVVAAMQDAPIVNKDMVVDGPASSAPRRQDYSLLLVLNRSLANAHDAAVLDKYLGLLESCNGPLTVALVLNGLAAASPQPQLTLLLRGRHLENDGKSLLLHAAQVLLHILHHARNLIPAAPPRVRVKLLRLATATLERVSTSDFKAFKAAKKCKSQREATAWSVSR
ncbi:hypothetical protein H9P43_006331 [Blastocladiella emersonii ATCC 22665]|nr:hypothetical protein H9P43_006331 [Blastocladiella emersonii ATCC 22665]